MSHNKGDSEHKGKNLPAVLLSNSVVKDDKPRFSKPIEQCALLKADAEGRVFTLSDYLGMCQNMCCPCCGKERTRRFYNRHRLKGEVIKDSTFEVLFLREELSILKKNKINRTADFFDAAYFLESKFDHWHYTGEHGFNKIDGYVGQTHINPLSVTFVKFQCHIHCAFLTGSMNHEQLLKLLNKTWKKFGGKEVQPWEKNDTTPLGQGSLLGIIDYLGQHPLKDYSNDEKLKFHKRVLRHVEQCLDRPCLEVFIDGPALSKVGFQKILERAKFEHLRETKRLGAALRHPSMNARRYCPTIQKVCLVEHCPKCKAFGKDIKKNGKYRSGKQSWKCKRCDKTWSFRRSIYEAKRIIKGTTITAFEAKHIYQAYLNNNRNASKTHREAGYSERKIQKVIEYKEKKYQ